MQLRPLRFFAANGSCQAKCTAMLLNTSAHNPKYINAQPNQEKLSSSFSRQQINAPSLRAFFYFSFN
jgi:hypothetical protein